MATTERGVDTETRLREQDRKTYKVQRLWPLVSGLVALALVVVGGILIALRQSNAVPYAIDQEWMDELLENRSPFWEQVALVFDSLGGGIIGVIVVPLVIIGLLLFARRKWAAVYFLTASVLSGLLVQVLKNTVERPRPQQILVSTDFGSFPSGHTANAATIAVVLAIIVHRWWVGAVGAAYVFCMMLSRNYLGAHWLTDTLGGMVLGAAVALIVWAPFAHRLHREVLRDRGVPPDPAVPES